MAMERLRRTKPTDQHTILYHSTKRVDTHQRNFNDPKVNLAKACDEELVGCQGHRTDVLGVFLFKHSPFDLDWLSWLYNTGIFVRA